MLSIIKRGQSMENFNNKLIEEKDHLLLSISGGVDSMVLLHYLYHQKNDGNFSLSVAHIDHQKRINSKKDAELVKRTCRDLNLPFYLYQLKDEDYDNFHDYAHKERYRFLSKTAKEIKADKIVLAHHLDDLAETIMMRMVRGSSFEGYQGILEKSTYDDVFIIRPMLHVSKEVIINYQKDHNIVYRQDESNLENTYTRNRYRHQIMPLLKEENPKYKEKFLQFSTYQKDAYDLIDHYAKSFVNKYKISNQSIRIHIPDFTNQFRIVQIDILKKIINTISSNTLELSYINLMDMLEIIHGEKPHLRYMIGNVLYLYKSYDFLRFQTHQEEIKNYQLELCDFGDYTINDIYDVNISKKPNKNYEYNYELCYNNLDLVFPIIIRNRRFGDRLDIQIGTKKLKDFFIDKKIPLKDRSQLPLIVNKDSEILFIPALFKLNTTGEHSIYIQIKKTKY